MQGRLGTGDEENINVFTHVCIACFTTSHSLQKIPLDVPVKTIACGEAHSACITELGYVYATLLCI